MPVGAQEVQSFAYSPDSRTVVAAGAQGKVFTLDPNELTQVSARQFPIPGGLRRAELSRDSTTLATLGIDKSCQVWDVKSGRRTLNIATATHTDVVRLSPDGKWLAAVGADDQGPHSVRVWNTATGQESRVTAPTSIAACTFSPDGHTLALYQAFIGLPLFGDLATGQSKCAVGPGHFRGIQALEFSADGKTLATSGLDHSIKFWDVETLAERDMILGPDTEAVALSFDPQGRTFVSLDRAHAVSVWDIATGEFVFRLGQNSHPTVDVRFSPDGSTLATRVMGHGPNSVIHFWPAPRED